MNASKLTLVGLMVGLLVSCSSVPDHPESHYQAGRKAHMAGDLDQAEDYYKQALTRDSDHIRARTELGDLYMKRRRPDRAIEQYTRTIKTVSEEETTPSQLYDLYKKRAKAYAQAEQYTEAIRDLTQVLEAKPDDLTARNLRGEIYRKVGDIDLAMSDFQHSLDIESNQNLPAYMGLVRVLIDRSDWKPAMNRLDMILNRWPELPSAHLLRALIHRELGDRDRMRSDLKKYLSLTNTDASKEDVEKALNDLAEQIEPNR